MKNLEEISIYNSKIKNSKKISDFANLKVLKLDGSLVDEPNFSDLIDNNIEFSYNEKFYLEENKQWIIEMKNWHTILYIIPFL